MSDTIVPMVEPTTFVPMIKASVITLVIPCSFGLILAITKLIDTRRNFLL